MPRKKATVEETKVETAKEETTSEEEFELIDPHKEDTQEADDPNLKDDEIEIDDLEQELGEGNIEDLAAANEGVIASSVVTEDVLNEMSSIEEGEIPEKPVVTAPTAKKPEQEAPKTTRRTGNSTGRVISQHLIGRATPGLKQSEYRSLNPEEEEDRAWANINEYARKRTIMYGRLSRISSDDKGNIVFFLTGLELNFEVSVPESEWWMESQRFGSNYDRLSDDEKKARRQNYGLHQMGAIVPFIISKGSNRKVLRSELRDKYHIRYQYTLLGSRKAAMDILQSIWFFGKTPRFQSGEYYQAHVLSVSRDYVEVECCGVETYMNIFDFSLNTAVGDLQKATKPGDSKIVRIAKCHIHHKGEPVIRDGRPTKELETHNWVHLTLKDYSTEQAMRNAAIMSLREGDICNGEVKRYNKQSRSFSIMLDNYAKAKLDKNSIGDLRLDRGDRVTVRVVSIQPDHAIVRLMYYNIQPNLK